MSAWRTRTQLGKHLTRCVPVKNPTEDPNNNVRTAYPHPTRQTPRRFRGPIENFTENPKGNVRLAYPHLMRHTPR
eukprot:7779667-Pyramimonas_sp.AAC.1